MSKLDVLNAYLAERLMLAVREILAAVEETVSEFKEENELLRLRLREERVGDGAARYGVAHPPSPHKGQQGGSVFKEEPAVNSEQQDCERRESGQKSEEQGVQRFDRMPCGMSECSHVIASGAPVSVFQPQGVKRDPDWDSVGLVSIDLKLHAVGKAETDRLPAPTANLAADEPDAVQRAGDPQAGSSHRPSPRGTVTRSSDGDGTEERQPATVRAVEQHGGRPRALKRAHLCTHCGKAFQHASSLKVHLLSLAGKKPHRCTQCEKAFSCRSHLKEHERIHTGERPYQCTICGKRFRLSGHLKDHVRVHTGERPFSCTQCGKRFKQRGGLSAHERIHAGETVSRRRACGKVYGKISQLNGHLHSHMIVKI